MDLTAGADWRHLDRSAQAGVHLGCPAKTTQAPDAMRTTTVHLNSEELAALIDREARARLNMSGRQFRAYWNRGALRNRTAAMEIAMLLRLEE